MKRNCFPLVLLCLLVAASPVCFAPQQSAPVDEGELSDESSDTDTEPDEAPRFYVNSSQQMAQAYSEWFRQFQNYARFNNDSARHFALMMGQLTQSGNLPLTPEDFQMNYRAIYQSMLLNYRIRSLLLSLLRTTGLLQHTAPSPTITSSGVMLMTAWGQDTSDYTSEEFAIWAFQQKFLPTEDWLDDFYLHLQAFLEWLMIYLREELGLSPLE